MLTNELVLPNNSWGVEVIVDWRNGNSNVKSYNAIKSFGEDLINSIGMEAWGNAEIVHFGKGDKAGYTYSQLITTSNICAHLCDESRNGYLNVFSCKNVTEEAVRNVVERWFCPEQINSSRIVRGVW